MKQNIASGFALLVVAIVLLKAVDLTEMIGLTCLSVMFLCFWLLLAVWLDPFLKQRGKNGFITETGDQFDLDASWFGTIIAFLPQSQSPGDDK